MKVKKAMVFNLKNKGASEDTNKLDTITSIVSLAYIYCFVSFHHLTGSKEWDFSASTTKRDNKNKRDMLDFYDFYHAE